MRDRSREQKEGGEVEGRKVDIDQMHVQTNSGQAQHTKNNVAGATLALRVCHRILLNPSEYLMET